MIFKQELILNKKISDLIFIICSFVFIVCMYLFMFMIPVCPENNLRQLKKMHIIKQDNITLRLVGKIR